MAVAAIAISSLVITVALAVSGGFRREIRDGVSALSGDVTLSEASVNWYGVSDPLSADSSAVAEIMAAEGVREVRPAVYRAGIVSAGEEICGVLVKGVPSADTVSLSVSIPKELAARMRLGVGDDMLTYFVGDKVKARRFKVAGIYDSPVEADGRLVVFADIDDIRRLNGWGADEASVMEVFLDEDWRTRELMRDRARALGYNYVAQAAPERFPQLFDWLDLIDLNVLAILVLMTVVAGFNMISGLLILLFRNISTIGVLKSLGMDDRKISKVFLGVSSRLVAEGLLIGNALALAFCLVQGRTHLLKLDPSNYFVSFVPVDVNVFQLIVADAAAFVIIMLLLLIPLKFIAKVDPALTVRSE